MTGVSTQLGAACCCCLAIPSPSQLRSLQRDCRARRHAQDADRAEQSRHIFQNVRIFDGKSVMRYASAMNVSRPREYRLRKSRKTPLRPISIANAKIIAGGGRTLMPGLIDMHWHTMLVRPTPAALLAGTSATSISWQVPRPRATLMRGFTTVRDMGGPAFGLKRAIDEGTVAGPRIFPSGAMITVTSGHGDFRQPFEVPRVLGVSAVSRGADRSRHDRG